MDTSAKWAEPQRTAADDLADAVKDQAQQIEVLELELEACRQELQGCDRLNSWLLDQNDKYDDDLWECRKKLREQAAEARRAIEFASEKAKEVSDCREALAVAQANMRDAVKLLGHIPQVLPRQLPSRGWIPGGCATISDVSKAIDTARDILYNGDDTALEMLLEKRRMSVLVNVLARIKYGAWIEEPYPGDAFEMQQKIDATVQQARREGYQRRKTHNLIEKILEESDND